MIKHLKELCGWHLLAESLNYSQSLVSREKVRLKLFIRKNGDRNTGIEFMEQLKLDYRWFQS